MTTLPTRRSVLGMAGAVAVAGTALSGTAGAVTDTATDRIPRDLKPGGALDRLVADLAAKDEFSGGLLLTHRGRTVLARSYGMADKARAVSNGPDTIFGLASVTKLITGIAVGQLAQARAVAYTDAIGKYVDGFADTMTVHHLLTHTSGLGDFHGAPGYWETARSWTSTEQVLAGTMDFIRRETPAFAPGAGTRYSNSAYFLLGEIVAKASGQSFVDYLREHVFRPAGMDSTDFYTKPQRRDDPRIARPYRKEPSGERVDTLEEHVFIDGAFSTCGDMERLARALLGNKLLTPAVTQHTLSGKLPMAPQGPEPLIDFQAYGGLAILSANNEWCYKMSGGSTGGASTDFAMYPDRGWVSVVLSNYQAETVRPIARLARQLITR
jgi:CubicO group peptidase (beta-lactamase class C family)